MKVVVVTCASCSRSWKLNSHDSLYLQLDLSSRPCPHCEAYTLSSREPAEAAPHGYRRRGRGGFARRAALAPSLG